VSARMVNVKVAAVVLYCLAALAEIYVFVFLIRVVVEIRRVRGQDRRFVIDGGDAAGNVEGAHLGTTLETFASALDQPIKVTVALGLGIVLGFAGNLCSVLSS
jgi:hypothetical protein